MKNLLRHQYHRHTMHAHQALANLPPRRFTSYNKAPLRVKFMKRRNFECHLLFHLLNDIKIFNLFGAGPLRANYFVLNQIRVQAADVRLFALFPLFFSASTSKAESALKSVHSAKVLLLCLHGRIVLGKSYKLSRLGITLLVE